MNKDRDPLRKDPAWVAARFDRISGLYPLSEHLLLVPRRARHSAIKNLQLNEGEHVLVVGCGQGPSLRTLAGIVGPGGQVVGVDLSRKMLQRAHRIVERHSLANVELWHTDVFQYRTNVQFDAILFEFSLTSFGEPLRGLHQAWEFLKPGGTLVVLDGQLPPKLQWLSRPMMPLIRWTLERTVLGDPDMRPIEELQKLGPITRVEWFRGRTYFVVQLIKDQRSVSVSY